MTFPVPSVSPSTNFEAKFVQLNFFDATSDPSAHSANEASECLDCACRVCNFCNYIFWGVCSLYITEQKRPTVILKLLAEFLYDAGFALSATHGCHPECAV